MIHTASLVHDDVLDECNTRRGEPILYIIARIHYKRNAQAGYLILNRMVLAVPLLKTNVVNPPDTNFGLKTESEVISVLSNQSSAPSVT